MPWSDAICANEALPRKAFLKERNSQSLLFIFLLLLTSLITLPVWADDNAPAPAPSTKDVDVVTVGIYPLTIYDLNMASSTFYMNAYIWFRWKGNVNPINRFEFANGVEGWSITKTKIQEEPVPQPDGSKFQSIRAQGRFFRAFSLLNFPIDEQVLPLTLESSDRSTDEMVFQLDEKDTGHSPELKIPGWIVTGWDAKVATYTYDTRFGDLTARDASSYSRVYYQLKIKRPLNFFIWKLLLPLTIVLCATWTALLLPPRMVEARTGMPATALLTTVFLQQSYSASLPEVGSLVLLDKIYVIAYILIVSTISQVIYLAAKFDMQEPQHVMRAKQLDRYAVLLQIAVFVLGIIAILLSKA